MAALSKFLFGAGLLFLAVGVAITILPGGFSSFSPDNAGPGTPVPGQQEGANGQTVTETSAPDTPTATEQAPSTTGNSEEASQLQTDQEQAGETRDEDESDADGEEEKKGKEDEKDEKEKKDEKGEKEKKDKEDGKGKEGDPRVSLLLLPYGGLASRW